MLLSKRELATVLRVTVVTVDAWLARWPDFPVVVRGSNGRAWQFDGDAVKRFVQAKRDDAEAAQRARREQVAQMALPLFDDAAPAAGTNSPAALLTMARLRRIQREEAVACGRLVDARRVRQMLADVLGRLGRGQRGAIQSILAGHGVEADRVAQIGAAFEQLQRQAVEAVAGAMPETEAPVRDLAERDRPALRLVAG